MQLLVERPRSRFQIGDVATGHQNAHDLLFGIAQWCGRDADFDFAPIKMPAGNFVVIERFPGHHAGANIGCTVGAPLQDDRRQFAKNVITRNAKHRFRRWIPQRHNAAWCDRINCQRRCFDDRFERGVERFQRFLRGTELRNIFDRYQRINNLSAGIAYQRARSLCPNAGTIFAHVALLAHHRQMRMGT